eukprot:jgi/Chrzof1/4540/Cz14g17160.t1
MPDATETAGPLMTSDRYPSLGGHLVVAYNRALAVVHASRDATVLQLTDNNCKESCCLSVIKLSCHFNSLYFKVRWTVTLLLLYIRPL